MANPPVAEAEGRAPFEFDNEGGFLMMRLTRFWVAVLLLFLLPALAPVAWAAPAERLETSLGSRGIGVAMFPSPEGTVPSGSLSWSETVLNPDGSLTVNAVYTFQASDGSLTSARLSYTFSFGTGH